MISIIIPVLHEASRINALIHHLRVRETELRMDLQGSSKITGRKGLIPPGVELIIPRIEIIVVDGDPDRGTIGSITDPDVITLTSGPGRGVQMNAGAERTQMGILLFLHADTRLPENALSLIRSTILDHGFCAGAFSLDIEPNSPALSIIARFTTLRSRLTRIPYGDQGIFMDADVFQEMGGYREIPIMEDLELMRRLRRSGKRIRILREKVTTSSRRWDEEGRIIRTLRNWNNRVRYRRGVSPEKLVASYIPHGEESAVKERDVAVPHKVNDEIDVDLSQGVDLRNGSTQR